MAALSGLGRWLEAGTPFTDIRLMGGLANRRRSLLDSDGPVVDRYVLVGDASLYTNATFGQGVALGFWQAQALAHRADLIDRDHLALLHHLETWTDQTLGARYAEQVQVDEAIIAMLRDGITGAPLMDPQDPFVALVALRTRGDTEAGSAAFRIDHLLTEPDDDLDHPPLNERVTSYLSNAPTGDAGPGPAPESSVRGHPEVRLSPKSAPTEAERPTPLRALMRWVHRKPTVYRRSARHPFCTTRYVPMVEPRRQDGHLR